MTILEELYYGNVQPITRAYGPDSALMKAIHLRRQNEDKLVETLTDAQRERFEKYEDAATEAHCLSRYDAFAYAFAYGFRLGMRLAIDAMEDMDDWL